MCRYETYFLWVDFYSEVPDYGLDDGYRIETGLGVHQGLFVQGKLVGAWSSPLQSKAEVKNDVFIGRT
jgi:hypothetical protein